MKPLPIILTVTVVLGIIVFVWEFKPEAPMPTLSSARNTNSNASASPVTATAPTVATVDKDGCVVIDLRGVPATEHDPAQRVYRWVVEHPTDAACVRQYHPSIPEPVIGSKTEKIRGTNNWQHKYYY